MSQHSQRAQLGPSQALVMVVRGLVALSALVTGYVTNGPWSEDQVIATVLGVGLTTTLAIWLMGLIGERAVVADRARREVERVEQQGRVSELEAWQNAAVGLLDAYLTGLTVNFQGESIPEYIRARLTELPPEVEPQREELAEDDPRPSWNAFQLNQVAVPLPPRMSDHVEDSWHGDAATTQIFMQVDQDATEVIQRVR